MDSKSLVSIFAERKVEPFHPGLWDLKSLALWAILIVVAACMARPLRDPDLWFHIVSGRWILSHQQVPTQDYWNMFGVGKPWRS